jgi:hypothetical protein
MKSPDKSNQMFRAPKLTRTRIILALAVAVTADGLQLIGFPPVDQIIDAIAFGLTVCVLGFHLLLLPTFIAEFIPGVDMLPTWTACVIAVIALRKREKNAPPQTPSQIEDKRE